MKVLYVSLIALIFATPSFATGIGASAESADCVNGTLGTYTGPASLSANWNANTINLDFYDGEDKISSGTCTYDGGIELPNDPEKEGYEFSGWKVRRAVAAPTQCNLSNLDTSLTGIDYGSKQIVRNTNFYGEINVDKYGLTQPGQWATEFEYGIIYGTGKCSVKQGNNNTYKWNNDSNNWATTENELTAAGSGKYCWCKVEKYNTGNAECNNSSSNFVYLIVNNSPEDCFYFCPKWCAEYLGYNNAMLDAFRAAMYNMVE
jgi:hypothetical protein